MNDWLESVRIRSGGIFYCAPDWTLDTGEGFADFDLWLVFGGRGLLRSPRGVFELRTGDCFVFRPGERYVGSTDRRSPLRVAAFHFDLGGGVPGFVPLAFHRRVRETTFLRTVVARAIAAMRRSRTAQADRWAAAAVAEVLESDAGRGDAPPQVASLYERIDAVRAQIDENPGNAWSVGDMALKAGVCSDHFTRVFVRRCGVTPKRYAVQVRLDAARQLLISSDHPIGRVAELLGYCDVQFFSRQFAASAGVSPRAFRLTHRRGAPPTSR